MKDENQLRDLTSFLLEWRDTCAIDKCPQVRTKKIVNGEEIPELRDGKPVYVCAHKNDGESDEEYVARIKADIRYVHEQTDKHFRQLVLFARTPPKSNAAQKAEKAKAKREMVKGASGDDGDAANGGEEIIGLPDSGEEGMGFLFMEYEQPREGMTSAMRVPEGRAFSDDDFQPDDMREDTDVFPSSSSCSIRGRMVSEYIDIVRSWDEDNANKKSAKNKKIAKDKNAKPLSHIHAFHILENYLYNKSEIKGRPFKNHLFEEIAASNGVGNVWGYLTKLEKSVLKEVAKASFRTVTGDQENIGQDGGLPSLQVSTQPEVDSVEIDEAADILKEWVAARWPEFSIDDKLALLCTVLEISMNTPEIVAKTTVGRQAFYNRKRIAREAFENLSEKGISWVVMAKTLAGPFQSVLCEFVSRDSECAWFMPFLEKAREKAGK